MTKASSYGSLRWEIFLYGKYQWDVVDIGTNHNTMLKQNWEKL